jgi:hypothetical protein
MRRGRRPDPKVELKIVINDDFVDIPVDTILASARRRRQGGRWKDFHYPARRAYAHQQRRMRRLSDLAGQLS